MTNDDMTAVLECAALAPSVHNTQPWRFDVAGDTIEVRAERDRQLSYLDPTGRQLHVSCGAAIEFAFLAARSIGRECTVRLLPDGGDPDLLARIQLGRARVATPTERLLAEAIPLRYTDRGPYTDRAVPADLVDDVRARAADLDVWIRTVDDADDRRALVTVLSVAEQSEAADARYGEELARWTGTDGDVGVPADAVAGRWPSDRVSHVPLRDFTGHASQPSVEGRGDASPPSVERDFLLMLGTPDDDPLAWLSAGRALGWALLCAASVGVSAQPLGPATDLPHARATLRHDLGLVGYPQFVVRMGYGTDRPRTRRRHVVPA